MYDLKELCEWSIKLQHPQNNIVKMQNGTEIFLKYIIIFDIV